MLLWRIASFCSLRLTCSNAPPRRSLLAHPPKLLGILLTLISVVAAFVTALLVKAISGELPVLTMLMFRFIRDHIMVFIC